MCFGDARVGAGEQHHPVGDLREAGPDLLAVDDVVVAVLHGPGLERREVRARVGLGVALAPDLLAGEDLLEVALLLRVGAVGDDRRAGHAEAEDVERRRRPVEDQLLVEEELLHPREPAPPVLLGPREPEEPGLVELPLPVAAELVELGPRHVAHDRARGPVRGQVGREPGAHLGAERLLLGSEPEVHRSSAAWNRATPVYSTRSAGRDERAGGSGPLAPSVGARPAACAGAARMPSSRCWRVAHPEGAADSCRAQTLKIEHARYVVTLDGERRIIQDGSILVEGGRISRVGKAAELAGAPADRVIDARHLAGHPRASSTATCTSATPTPCAASSRTTWAARCPRLQAPDGDDRGGGVPHDAARPRGAPEERHRRASSIRAAPSSRTRVCRRTRTPASA